MKGYSFRDDPRITAWQREKLKEFCSTLERDSVKLATDLGLKVFLEDLMPYERGYLERAPSFGSASGWIVKLNRRDSRETQNFTVSHEIGHFVLHGAHLDGLDQFDGRINRDSDAPFSYLQEPDQIREAEANKFAATLLMPPNLFKPAFARLEGDLHSLARLFDVSATAVLRRARELGLNASSR